MGISEDKKNNLDNLLLNLSKKLANKEYIQAVLEVKKGEYKTSSVAVSYPSLCILFSELHLNFPTYEFAAVSHKYLEEVNTYLSKNNPNDISLFDGLCGVGFAANCMSNNGKYYQEFIENLNEVIVSKADKSLLQYKEHPLNEFTYDIMYGLTGIANYFIQFKSNTRIKRTLLRILKYLVSLCQDDENGFPKFMIKSSQSPLFLLRMDKQVNYVNLGVAHGVPGILLLLSNAYEAGILFDGQLEAIKYLTSYISSSCVEIDDDIFWEAQTIVGIGDYKKTQARDAWCYGAPGVAYSLLKASIILADDSFRDLAIKSEKQSLKRLREVNSPTFCHGLAGLCCLARKFYEYTEDLFFYEIYMQLSEDILKSYSKDNPFGFKNVELEKGILVNNDEIGILNGTSGIILTLLSCYRPVKSHWDAIFLL